MRHKPACGGTSRSHTCRAIWKPLSKLPPGIGYEWSGTSYEERVAGSQAPFLFAVSVLVVFLFWDSHPVGALVGVTLVYLAIGAAALVVLQRSRETRPFAATLAV